MKKSLIASILISSFFPVFAYAQLTKTSTFFQRVLEIVKGTLIQLVFILALLFFFWGVAKYIWSASPGNKEEAKTIMIWGVVALFVMSSVWGLVRFLQTELNIDQTTNGQIPTIGGSSSGSGGSTGGGTVPLGP
jgi:uncharacterized membrane protein YgcG